MNDITSKVVGLIKKRKSWVYKNEEDQYRQLNPLFLPIIKNKIIGEVFCGIKMEYIAGTINVIKGNFKCELIFVWDNHLDENPNIKILFIDENNEKIHITQIFYHKGKNSIIWKNTKNQTHIIGSEFDYNDLALRYALSEQIPFVDNPKISQKEIQGIFGYLRETGCSVNLYDDVEFDKLYPRKIPLN